MNWWVSYAMESGGAALVIAWAFWVVFSIVLHELGHGWTAIALGDRTPIETGHMTWNPLVHMGYMSLLVFAIFGIAWGAMPVDRSRLRGRYGDALVAVAGPAVNLALAVLASMLGVLWVRFGAPLAGANAGENLTRFFWIGGFLNIALLMLNLLPVPPLDGSRIIGNFVPAYERFAMSERGAVFGLLLFLGIFLFAARPLMQGAAVVVDALWGVGLFALGGGAP